MHVMTIKNVVNLNVELKYVVANACFLSFICEMGRGCYIFTISTNLLYTIFLVVIMKNILLFRFLVYVV